MIDSLLAARKRKSCRSRTAAGQALRLAGRHGGQPESEEMTTPAHVAIIMDGNGRWAKARGLPRLAGHRAGVEALRQTVSAAGEMGIPWLTVYAFSSENWSRPKSEVSDLLGLLKLFIRRDLAELHQNGVRVQRDRRARGPAARHPAAARRGRDADRPQHVA